MQEEHIRSQQSSTSSERSTTDDDKIKDGQPSGNHESVIDYAKNTMNSFLSMYGYEERITTETLKSNIKDEPLSPRNKEESLLSQSDSEDIILSTGNAPRTATVMPMPSAQSESQNKGNKSSSQSLSLPNDQPIQKRSGLPPKPITPYMRYRNMIFEEIKHQYPGCSPYDLATLISSKWSKLTDSERKVWEDQHEEDMKEYNESVNKYYNIPTAKEDWMQEKKMPDNLLTFVENISIKIEPQSPAKQNTQGSQPKGSSSSSKDPLIKTIHAQPRITGLCHWCKRRSFLQDFSTLIDGREIYCTGLCSEKCFNEASKQICNVESGSIKPRYVKSSRSSSFSNREETRCQSTGSISEGVTGLSTTFNWENYLSETQATAAPWMYFKQARDPPPNLFTVGMKLEALYNADHGGSVFRSLATVVAVSGSRLMLHFDGAESSTDVWKISDSEDIYPVGLTEENKLRAPKGYKYDISQYNNFYASSLQNAEIAPARLFKKEPKSPLENYFSTGMKVEAVNRQNPSVIGVATVTNVDGDQLKIEFDGIKGLCYWCLYTDRDLFPAGWCSRAGHPLQPPPGTKSMRKDRFFPRSSTQGSSTPLVASVSGETRSQPNSSFRSSLAVATIRESESRLTNWKEKTTSPNNVELFINSDCYCGPYVDKRKFELIPRVYRGSIVNVLKNVLEDTIKSANDSKTVFGFLKPGRGNCVITAVCDGVTYQCCLNSVDRVSKFWSVLEQFSDNLRCCTNLFSSAELHAACSRCLNNQGHVTVKRSASQSCLSSQSHHSEGECSRTITSTSMNYDYYKNSYRQEKVYDASSYSMVAYHSPTSETNTSSSRHTLIRNDSVFEQPRQDLSTNDKLSQEPIDVESRLYDSEKEDVNVDGFDEPIKKKRKLKKIIAGGIELSTAPKSWSIDDVTDFIDLTDLKDLKEKFRENEIDGKALLLLQRDLVLSHMGFKLGPAVKLLDLIEELKVVQKNFV